MNDILMKKNDNTRFLILKKLIWSKQGLSIEELMILFDVTNKTIYRHIDGLKNDLACAFPAHDVQLIQTSRLLTIQHPTVNLIYVIDYMHLYYLKSSNNFSIIEAILTKVYPSIESLAQDLHLSTSYTYKTISTFNIFLKKFNLKIKFNLSNPRSNILGEEVNLRLFLFFGEWMVFKGIDMPLGNTPLSFKTSTSPIKHHLTSSNQLMQLTHYQSITYFRIVIKKKKISLSEHFIDYLYIFEHISPTSFPTEIKKSIDKKFFSDSDIKQEEAFFGFATRFFITDIDSVNTKMMIAKKLIDSELPLTNFIHLFLENFSTVFKLNFTTEEYFSVYYLLAIQLFYYQFVEIDISLLDPAKNMKTMLQTNELNQLEKFTAEQLDTPLIKVNSKEILVPHFAEVLYTILKNTKKERLTIFVHYSRSIYLNDFIKNNLFKTFSPESIRFTQTIREADLVISDIFEEVEKKQQVFYLENPYDLEIWHELILFISDCLF